MDKNLQVKELNEEVSAFAIVPFIGIVLLLSGIILLIATIANTGNQFAIISYELSSNLAPSIKGWARPFLNIVGIGGTLQIAATAFLLGLWIVLSSTNHANNLKFSVKRDNLASYITAWILLLVVLAQYTALYNHDYWIELYSVATGEIKLMYVSNQIGTSLGLAIAGKFGMGVYWLIQFWLIVLIYILITPETTLKFKVVIINSILAIPLISYITAIYGWDFLPWHYMEDRGGFSDKGMFANDLGIGFFVFFKELVARNGNLWFAHTSFYVGFLGFYSTSYLLIKAKTGIEILRINSNLKKKVGNLLLHIMNQAQEICPKKPQEKLEAVKIKKLIAEDRKDFNTQKGIDKQSKPISNSHKVSKTPQSQTPKKNLPAPIPNKPLEIKPPKRIPTILKTVMQLQEIIKTIPSWNGVVEIDSGKNHQNLKTGLSKYLIPVKIIGGGNAEILNNGSALQHISDRLTENFWDLNDNDSQNLSSDDEKKYLIRCSITKSKGKTILMVDKEKRLRRSFTFLEFQKQIDLIGVIKKAGHQKVLLGLDQLGNPILDNVWDCKHIARQGATQSGKSNAVMMSIVSAMLSTPPDKLKFLIVDAAEKQDLSGVFTKKVSNHVIGTASNREQAIKSLEWALKQAEKRGAARKKMNGGCVNLLEFNQKTKSKLPIIIVVVAELESLLAGNDKTSKQIAELISKLLRQGAADGIFVWGDSQAMYKSTLPLLPPNNWSARISFYNLEQTNAFWGQGQGCKIKVHMLARQGDALMLKDGGEPISMTTLKMNTDEISQILKYVKKSIYR